MMLPVLGNFAVLVVTVGLFIVTLSIRKQR